MVIVVLLVGISVVLLLTAYVVWSWTQKTGSKAFPEIYSKKIKSGAGKPAAIYEALVEISRTTPFYRSLNLSDALALASTFAQLDDPTLLAQLLRQAEDEQNLNMLRNEGRIRHLLSEGRPRQGFA